MLLSILPATIGGSSGLEDGASRGGAADPQQARKGAGTCRSPSAAAQEDDGDGLEHDEQVFAQALPTDVLEVVAHLGAHVVDRAVVVVVDLRQPGDAGLGPLAQRVLGDVA